VEAISVADSTVVSGNQKVVANLNAATGKKGFKKLNIF